MKGSNCLYYYKLILIKYYIFIYFDK